MSFDLVLLFLAPVLFAGFGFFVLCMFVDAITKLLIWIVDNLR